MTILNQNEGVQISKKGKEVVSGISQFDSLQTTSNPFNIISHSTRTDGKYPLGNVAHLDLITSYSISDHVLNYTNLKPFTKYKLYNDVKTEFTTQGFMGIGRSVNETTAYEITKFYAPTGEVRKYNTHAEEGNFSYFVSDADGNLSIRSLPSAKIDIFSEDYKKEVQFHTVISQTTPYTKPTGNFRLISVGEASQFVTVIEDDGNGSSVVTIDNNNDSGAGVDPGVVIGNRDDNSSSNDLPGFNIIQSSPGYVQSFYIDPSLFNQAKHIDLTSLDLFFRQKPNENNDSSTNKNVMVYLLPMDGDQPNLNMRHPFSVSIKDVNSINTSSDASIPTSFSFQQPIRLETGKFYAFGVELYDPEYVLWFSKVGHALVGTNNPSPGSSQEHRGNLYLINNIAQNQPTGTTNVRSTPVYDEDLKFSLYNTEYNVSGTKVVNLVNPAMEFLTLETNENIDILFSKSEMVYQETANSPGTVSITSGSSTLNGDGTQFEQLISGDRIIIIDSSNNDLQTLVTIGNIISDTELEISEPILRNYTDANFTNPPTAKVYLHSAGSNEIFLEESDASSSSYFQANGVIRSLTTNQSATIANVNVFPVSSFQTSMNGNLPSSFKIRAFCNFAYNDNGTYKISTENDYQQQIDLQGVNYITNYEAIILSRSLEVLNPDYLYNNESSEDAPIGQNYKSANFKFTFEINDDSIETSYESPEFDFNSIRILFKNWFIDNNINEPKTRHISTPLVLEKGKLAEDVRVIYNAYVPQGTSIKSYAKILHSSDSETIEEKPWTELELIGSPKISSKEDREDFRELQYTFPSFPVTETSLDGVVDTETLNSNNIVTGIGTQFSSSLEEGDIIKIHNPLFDENYGIFHVESVDSDTQITLSSRVTNNSIIDTGLKIDTLVNDRSAFLNADNKNIVRYFDNSGVNYDGYNLIMIKTEMYSTSKYIVPKLNDYRVIAISA